MLFDALTVSFCFTSATSAPALPVPPTVMPPPLPNRPLHIPLLRRVVPKCKDTEFGRAKQQKPVLENEYGHSNKRSSTGTNLCV